MTSTKTTDYLPHPPAGAHASPKFLTPRTFPPVVPPPPPLEDGLTLLIPCLSAYVVLLRFSSIRLGGPLTVPKNNVISPHMPFNASVIILKRHGERRSCKLPSAPMYTILFGFGSEKTRVF
uniref:Uncharacterized protein n=1 Tax=Helicotheca tamesis TaxID=374047 RepID=A0A7S2HT74_9STRA